MLEKFKSLAGKYCCDTYQADPAEVKAAWAVDFAFQLCFALWAYRNLYNSMEAEILEISGVLDEAEFSPGRVTETDITEDEEGEFFTEHLIFDDMVAYPERRREVIKAMKEYSEA